MTAEKSTCFLPQSAIAESRSSPDAKGGSLAKRIYAQPVVITGYMGSALCHGDRPRPDEDEAAICDWKRRMNDYRCPWGGNEIKDLDYWEHQPEECYRVVCHDCGREFEVSYYYEPVFNVEIPDVLSVCSECGVWNIFDYCGWIGFDAMEGCPLGYDKE